MMSIFNVYSPLEQFEVFLLFYQSSAIDTMFTSLDKAFANLLLVSKSLPLLSICGSVGCDYLRVVTSVLQLIFNFFFGLLNCILFSNFTLFLVLILFFLILFPLVSIQRDPFSTLFRWSGFWVRVIAFVANLAKSQLGRNGQRLFPILYVLFTFICGANLVGMIPYTFTVTSHIFVTFTLSSIMFLNTIFLGVRYNGILFLRLLLPAGSPMRLAPLLVGVEFVSFVARVFSLAIRLFANMMSGHTLLKILAKFAWDMFKGGAFGIIGALRPCFLVFFVTRLEVGIAVLQAYVFTLLVSIYFSEAKRGGH